MKVTVVIPARLASSRLPRKTLAVIGSMPMIEHVYRAALAFTPDVYVASSDAEIIDAVLGFGGKAVLTSDAPRSGTQRVAEAVHMLNIDSDIIINVQADEPFITPAQLAAVAEAFVDPSVQIASLGFPYKPDYGTGVLTDRSCTKFVMDARGDAMYFSRSVIPFVRNGAAGWDSQTPFFIHCGVYAFRRETLEAVSSLQECSLARAESLEQLTWLYNGYKIRMAVTPERLISVDTEDDLAAANNYYYNK